MNSQSEKVLGREICSARKSKLDRDGHIVFNSYQLAYYTVDLKIEINFDEQLKDTAQRLIKEAYQMRLQVIQKNAIRRKNEVKTRFGVGTQLEELIFEDLDEFADLRVNITSKCDETKQNDARFIKIRRSVELRS